MIEQKTVNKKTSQNELKTPQKDLKKPIPENYKAVLRSMGVCSMYYDLVRKKNFANVIHSQSHAITADEFFNNEMLKIDGGLETSDGDSLCGQDLGGEVHLDDRFITRVKIECIRQDVATTDIGEVLSHMAYENRRCFVSEWINSKPWDRVSRLQEWFDTIKCQDDFNEQLKCAYMFRWALSAIAMLFHDGETIAHGVLVLQGAQGLGKTSWVKSLCHAYPWAIGTGVSLDPHNTDSRTQAYSKWINELGELDSTLRRDIGALKAEITKDRDEWRPPYARTAIEFKRRTVFCASVNDANFLKDPTGNRRFWVLPVVSMHYDHDIDMQQVWAEVLENYFMRGYTWHLDHDEAALQVTSANEFQEICPLAELIESQLNWEQGASIWMSPTDATKAIGIKEPKKTDVNTVSRILKKRFADSKNMVRVLDGRRLFLLPPAKHP